MEARESINAGVTVIGAEAPSTYHIAPRPENPTQMPEGLAVVASQGTPGAVGGMEKKKRGRPRKYGPDGTVSKALSPMPISASAPPPSTGYFSGDKRGRGRPIGSETKQRHKAGMENPGEFVACSAGANFLPHLITVNKGEDVTRKIISFTTEGPRAICIISAVGLISNATLRQPDSSGGTLTYEGIFEILSLSGSFTPTEVGGSRVSGSGGLSVTLASPDGRVIGGMLAGLLVAGGPVQVVVGSFLPNGHQEPKPKKQKMDPSLVPNAPNATPMFPTSIDREAYRQAPEQNLPAQAPKSNMPLSNNWPPIETAQDLRKSTTDINISLQGD